MLRPYIPEFTAELELFSFGWQPSLATTTTLFTAWDTVMGEYVSIRLKGSLN